MFPLSWITKIPTLWSPDKGHKDPFDFDFDEKTKEKASAGKITVKGE